MCTRFYIESDNVKLLPIMEAARKALEAEGLGAWAVRFR